MIRIRFLLFFKFVFIFFLLISCKRTKEIGGNIDTVKEINQDNILQFECDKMYINSKLKVSLYKGPYLSSEILTKLQFRDEVIIKKSLRDYPLFTFVSYNDLNGYILTKYLSSDKESLVDPLEDYFGKYIFYGVEVIKGKSNRSADNTFIEIGIDNDEENYIADFHVNFNRTIKLQLPVQENYPFYYSDFNMPHRDSGWCSFSFVEKNIVERYYEEREIMINEGSFELIENEYKIIYKR